MTSREVDKDGQVQSFFAITGSQQTPLWTSGRSSLFEELGNQLSFSNLQAAVTSQATPFQIICQYVTTYIATDTESSFKQSKQTTEAIYWFLLAVESFGGMPGTRLALYITAIRNSGFYHKPYWRSLLCWWWNHGKILFHKMCDSYFCTHEL